MSITLEQEKPWRLASLMRSLAPIAGLVCVLFGLVALLGGYLLEIEIFYRVASSSPATNPFTAICFIIAGVNLCLILQSKYLLALRITSFILIALLVAQLLAYIADVNTIQFIPLFKKQLSADVLAGKNNAVGLNTLLMILCAGLSTLAYSFERINISQFLAFIALAFPSTSFTGYFFDIKSFYGNMSELTMLFGHILVLGTLMLTAHHGVLKAIFSPYLAGCIARSQIILGCSIIFIIGVVLYHSVILDSGGIFDLIQEEMHVIGGYMSNNKGALFGVFVISSCWLVVIIICVSAMFQEEADRKRRESERLLAQAAMLDSLTGLANRRRFFELGEKEIRRRKHHGGQFGVLIIDLDHFKKINDTKGHEMGDEVLVRISRCLEKTVRSTDLVCRYGGEEFAVILANISREGVQTVASNIRQKIQALTIDGWTNEYGPVTASIGGVVSDGSKTLKESLADADKALYEVKYSGRNQVKIA